MILEVRGIPSSDEGIFQSTQMHIKDLNLNTEEYLDIVADKAIFWKLINQYKQ